MCPFCMASAALMVGSVLSAGGLTALVKKLGAKKGSRDYSRSQIQRRKHG